MHKFNSKFIFWIIRDDDVLYYCAMYHLLFLKIVFYVFIVKILIFIAVLFFLHQIYTFFTIISFVSSIAAIQARTIYMGTMHSITTVSTSIRTPLPKHIIVTHCCKGYFYIYSCKQRCWILSYLHQTRLYGVQYTSKRLFYV